MRRALGLPGSSITLPSPLLFLPLHFVYLFCTDVAWASSAAAFQVGSVADLPAPAPPVRKGGPGRSWIPHSRGAERAGGGEGAAVVARGAIQFASVAAVIKVYFLLKASCVPGLPGRWGARGAPPGRGGGASR